MQLDYANIMRGGQNLVPDLRAQLIEDALLKQQNTAFQQQQEDRARKLAEAEKAQADEAEFRTLFDAAMMKGDAGSALALRNRFPQFAKKYEDVFNSLDEDQKRGDITQMGSIYARAQAGDFAGAASIIRGRIEADRAAGQDTADDEQILAGLESQDPIQRNAAMGTVAFVLASVQPKEFAATYGQLSKQENKIADERQYEFDVRTYGKDYADQAKLARDSKTLSIAPGGRLDVFGPDPATMGGGQTQGGGDPASGVGAGQGSAPERPALTRDQFNANLDALGAPRAIGLLNKSGIRVVVRNPQEARSLPSGTPLWLPDGSEGWAP